MQTPINIIDLPCGNGKTTKMIDSFVEDTKYLVILPYLSEIERLISQSKVEFFQPDENDNKDHTKSSSLENLLHKGLNVATTHEMYQNLVPMVRQGLLDDYYIIIDEVPDVVRTRCQKSNQSIQEFYINQGYLEVEEGCGLVKPTQKWWENAKQVSDTLDSGILNSAASGCLYLLDGTMFIWALPKTVLSAGRSVTVMTYKSEGSLLLPYLSKIGLSFNVSNDNFIEESFRQQASELVSVEVVAGLSKIPLSYSAQGKLRSQAKKLGKVANALKNHRERKMKGVPIDNILLTCRKDLWFEPSNDSNLTQFAKNTRLSKVNWIANTTRGTNKYMHCSHLIYLYNQHINPFIARWLNNIDSSFSDAYALTELIQWVWRSRIRQGQPITLYLPSERMQKIFEDWLNGD